MSNDAKLALVFGVGLVLLIAVVFFRKDSATAKPAEGNAAAVKPAGPLSAPAVRGQRHVVKVGDTLFSIARQYYGDSSKFVDIYRLNQDVLQTPEHLTPGQLLLIPQPSP